MVAIYRKGADMKGIYEFKGEETKAISTRTNTRMILGLRQATC